MIDGTPFGAAGCGYQGVGLCGGAIERQDAPGKVLPEHPLHFGEQPVPSCSCRQYLDAVSQFGFTHSGEEQVESRLPGNPVHNAGVGNGAQQLRDDVGVIVAPSVEPRRFAQG